eukprot:631269-Rhodomonas_salina.1
MNSKTPVASSFLAMLYSGICHGGPSAYFKQLARHQRGAIASVVRERACKPEEQEERGAHGGELGKEDL